MNHIYIYMNIYINGAHASVIAHSTNHRSIVYWTDFIYHSAYHSIDYYDDKQKEMMLWWSMLESVHCIVFFET